MRESLGLVLGATAICGLAVMAAEKPPDSFQQAMKSNGATVQKIGKDADAKDYDAIAAGAATLKTNFMGPIAKYFTDTKGEDGLAKCKTALTASESLEKAAKAKDEMAVADARKALTGTCGGCHMAHREKMPDGSFQIK
jgi:cytochrome c556